MYLKVFAIFCLLIGLSTPHNLQPDINNPILVNPPWNAQTGAKFIIRFSFPSATPNAIGPSAVASSGLTYRQFIGLVFPSSVGAADLLFEQGSAPKWACELTDGTNTYKMTAVQSVPSPIITTMAAENNIAYCRLDDISSNVPLKTGLGITYKLTITLNDVKISSTNFLRSISLFTSTSNNPEKMIIDSVPVLGTVALYGDYTTYSPKSLEITNAAVSVTQGPSVALSATIVYAYNQFDLVLSLKSSSFITAADHLIVIKYPTDAVTPASTVVTTDNAPNDTLQIALKGNLSLKAFGSDGLYLDGISEDLIPNRQFKLSLKGWKSLDSNIGNSLPITVIVYYKNTYSILSYSSNNIFMVTKSDITLTSGHPETWDVYKSGAWPIAFTFKSNNDLSNGGWVVIQHTNAVAVSATTGNKLTFIPSTCDFSGNDTSFDNSFGKRPSCYPLRTIDVAYEIPSGSTSYNGSGFFFFMKGTITGNKVYKVTVWAFFDVCGGTGQTALDVINSSTSYTVPKFSMTIYKTLNPAVLNESRFTTMPSGVTRQNTIASSIATDFSGKCWNNLMFEADAAIHDDWTATTLNANRHAMTASNSPAATGILHYREIFDWVAFSETTDNHASLTVGTWPITPVSALTPASVGMKYLYSSSNSIASGSFFLVAYAVPTSTDTNFFKKSAFPVLLDGTHPPGKWVWQFPSSWFTAGNGYKGTSPAPSCYASWSITATGITTITGAQLLTTVTNSVPIYGSLTAQKNFFAAVSDFGTPTGTIDTTNSVLPPDWTSGRPMRLVSAYHDGTTEQRWRIADYAITVGANPMNVSFFTSCVKWVSSLPTITSLYTYIDVQIKWNYIPTGGTTTGLGTTVSNIRMIKLFPETGVINDFSKNPTTSNPTSSPMISHNIYTSSTKDSVCLLEMSGAGIQALKDTASDTLVIWMFFGTLLESDYNDASATYPVSPLASGINAYGLQSGQPMDNDNAWITPLTNFTPLLYQFKLINTSQTLSLAADTINWPMSSNYFWFMGSVLYLTSITSTNLTGTTEVPFFIPYYCPRYYATYLGVTVINAAIFPTAMAAWMTVRGYNSVVSLNTWVTYIDDSNTAVTKLKLMGNKWKTATQQDVIKSAAGLATAATLRTGTLKFSPYTESTSYLYVYNGSVSAAEAASVFCTGHSLFLSNLITIDSSVTTSFTPGYTGAIGSFTGKTYYVFGKPFNKAVYYGLGTSEVPAAANMNALIATGDTLSGNYYTGIKRPSVESFISGGNLVLTDRIAYFCAAVNKDNMQGLSNYVINTTSSNAVRHFILDWSRNISGSNNAWLTPSVGFDKTDVAKSDVAGNFKITLSPPQSIPAGTIIRFTANSNALTGNSICGLIITSTGIAQQCDNDNATIKCTVPTTGTSYTICCYNVVVSDTLSLATVVASFPADSTIAGISSYLTSDIYSAASQISSSNPYLFTTNNASLTDIIGTKSASITSVVYSQTNQESGIGKVTFTINMPREPTRDMKLSIIGDLSGMVIPGNIPRCLASFGKDTFGSNWDSGDALIDTCSSNNIASGTPIVVTTKKMAYKCGQTFSKTMYVSLWPVVIVNWAGTSVNKSFKVAMQLTSSDNIALNTQAFDMTLATATSAKPNFVGQWDTLCTVASITPKIPGEIADYQFDIDLDTNKASLTNATPNEVTIFWPYQYFGSYIPNVLCYYSGLLNCSFTDEGILNIRFATNLAIGTGKKISITIIGVPNPAIDVDYSFPCTINSTNFSTGLRTTIISGSGKLAGGITTAGVTSFGALRFLQIASPVSDKNPRNVSVHKFRIAFDNAINLTASPLTIANNPVMHVYFPSDYKLAWYTNKPSAVIDEYTSDAQNAITKSSTISPASTSLSGNRITLTFTQNSLTFGTNWRYWDITITNIINPTDTTVQKGPPITQTTRPFQITLTNSNLNALYRTYTNTNTYISDLMTTAIDSNIGWNRGNSFNFDNSKWVVDIYAESSQLNMLTVKAGRYLKAYYNIKPNNSIAIMPWITTMSLNDSTFKTSKTNYLLSTSYGQPLDFYVGCACGTAPGYYLVNFSSSDTTNFATLSPVIITVDTSSKGTISFQTPPTIPAAGSIWVGIILSDPNFDALNINWVAAENAKNDETAKISNVVIPPGTITPTSTSSTTGKISSIYSVFSITSSSTTIPPQNFKSADPNACYTWGGANTISFTISGQTAIIPSSLNLATYFKYANADTDSSLTAKNSIKFTFTPPAAPIYIYCALACIDMAYPSDLDIQTPKVENTEFLQFYNTIISNTTPIDIIFSGLVRGMKYHMRCIIQSTQGDTTLRTSSSVNIENYVLTGATNTTTVDIKPSSPQATQCAQWQFLSEPGQQTRLAVVNYCQRLFSGTGFWNNGCIICTYSDMSYTTPGLTLPTNITCPTSQNATKLRYLQSTEVAPPNVTADVPTTLTVCPIAHPICSTDVSGNKVYADYFNQMISDLKTTALFKSTLNIDNVRLNTTNPTVIVLDSASPDITKLSISLSSQNANGAVSWTAMYSTPLLCYWQITDATAAPSFSSVQACTDTAWCGKSRVGPAQTTISTTSFKPFTAGKTYNIYMACVNDIPMAQKTSSVKSVASFTIPTPSPVIPTPTTNTTTSASYLSLSFLLLLILLSLLLN